MFLSESLANTGPWTEEVEEATLCILHDQPLWILFYVFTLLEVCTFFFLNSARDL